MNEILKIGCPLCGNFVRVRNIPDIQKKVYTCNVCGTKSRIADSRQLGYENAPASTLSSKVAQGHSNPQNPQNSQNPQNHTANQIISNHTTQGQHPEHQSIDSGSRANSFAQVGDIVKIKCRCGLILSFAYKVGAENSIITCPNCKQRSRIQDLQRVYDKPLQTLGSNSISNSSSNSNFGSEPRGMQNQNEDSDRTRMPVEDDRTTYAGLTSSSNSSKGRCLHNALLRVKGTTETFPLLRGKNVIGKKANSSTASIQIETPTRRMSREHLVIEGMDTPSGTAYYVSLYKEKVNPTFVGDSLLEYGDKIRIENGTELRLPDVTLVFEIIDNDKTELN